MSSECIHFSISREVSTNLFIRKNAINFFNTKIEKAEMDNVAVDFKDVTSISYSFAHEYLLNKRKSHKKINEVNVPDKIQKMFDIIESSDSPQPHKLENQKYEIIKENINKFTFNSFV